MLGVREIKVHEGMNNDNKESRSPHHHYLFRLKEFTAADDHNYDKPVHDCPFLLVLTSQVPSSQPRENYFEQRRK